MKEPAEVPAGLQLGALLGIRTRLKRRACCGSCCSVLSPPIFVAILVLGYSFSEDLNVLPNSYTQISFDVGSLLSGVLPSLGRRLDQSILDTNLLGPLGQLLPVLDGPLPIVPINNFMDLAGLAKGRLNNGTYQLITSALSSRLGNVLSLGTLHFAPDSPRVRELVQYARGLDPELDRSVPLRVHATEAAAIAYVMEHAGHEHTWAVISFRHLSPLKLNYSIRLH